MATETSSRDRVYLKKNEVKKFCKMVNYVTKPFYPTVVLWKEEDGVIIKNKSLNKWTDHCPQAFTVGVSSVSYTHLDVYKRQVHGTCLNL